MAFRSGQHHRGNAIARAVQRAQHFKSVALRHEEIEHQHVRMVFLDQLQRLLTVGGRAHHFKIRLRLQQCRQRLTQHRMVIGNHDGDRVRHIFMT